jgi:hypothetical protein
VTRGNGARAGVVGAGRQHGAANEHRWGPGVAPGKKINGGAHPIGGASGGAVGRRDAVAVNGSGVGTVVADDGALALHHGEGE